MPDNYLVTGAMGCIGAWAVRHLLHEGHEVTAFDVAITPHRLKLILSDEELSRVRFVQGDITDFATVERTFREQGITHVVHLAGLQIPACKANPVLGAQVNVVGTVNVFEAAKRTGLKRVAYASSMAVYGLSEEYDTGPLPHDAPLRPRSHYGVYKQANEGTARVYWLDDGISSIGLRPYVVYGPGRDQGMTSHPTKAMLAAAAGQNYHIPFGGRASYQYAGDTARIFIEAARVPYEGAEAYNMRGTAVHMAEIVAAIEANVPTMQGRITYDAKPLPFPEETDEAPLASAIPGLRFVTMADGVAETISIFRAALAEGRIAAEQAG